MASFLRTMAVETGLSEVVVQRIMQSAPHRYKHYEIDKRSGGKRQISQPATEVKLLQRVFVELYLSKLPVHPAAMAYLPNKSILDNANAHAEAGSILKMDFKDFFPSIRKASWMSYCAEFSILENHAERDLAASLLFQRSKGSGAMQLAIGAPSSPALSNILMFQFDEVISSEVSKDKVVYTRYADDLTFSADRSWNLVDVEKTVKRALREIAYPRLQLHPDKTIHVTKKFSRTVTGLVLANDGRVTIGKRRKRAIHAATHSASLGRLDDRQMQKLAGMLAFVHSVEPAFMGVLERRYGSETIMRLQTVGSRDRRNLRPINETLDKK
ncbi:retron St85 family RNA-directed DNA polymerase [Agrobacterium rosae]|uniref:retron St85 family RNA-directed DNA polymerase n=1 Tax=Agrobacterium rosae TaxID=1972867 RepID=UPI0019D3DA87|nr:retron St85 family RNA-directed DNA polymerase [Agrobacterium rosae]MBN7806456.1 retron St85 family RNA-directed DNA polymerase [Agrobacterium rosae]MBN7806601.1 retron St85 family RNA-directed DNA polymerase [Agrobacterium rosae]